MTDQTTSGVDDPQNLARWTEAIARGQAMMARFAADPGVALRPSDDPLGLAAMWRQVLTAAATDPATVIASGAKFMTDAMALWQGFLSGTPEATAPPVRDKRFAAPAWAEAPVFDFLRRSYLLASDHVLNATASLSGLGEAARAKALFHTRQWLEAMSPANFPLTNPEVLAATRDSGGENLLKGLEHMLADLERGRMRMTDEAAFEVGRDVAATPGKVVFENRLFQLIQYSPATAEVFETPLLIFPPWINKFYILDLTPEKSFIRFAVENGLTVFVVSWKNADASLADATLDTYVGEGQLTALGEVLKRTGAPSAHVIGYCVAGTVLAATLAYLEAKGQADRVASATFFTAQIDFSDAGDLKLFTDDAGIATVEKAAANGVTDGRALAATFNMLRPNDLIWSYVVNNYLLGKDYFPFDLLYWNSDATNVPACWHLSYLRDMYRDNLLVQPGGISVAGVPIDLRTVRTPTYIQAGRDDHIAPAKSVYRMTQVFAGPMRFVLAGSGHIAGVVNPPGAKKYQHWTSDTLPPTLAEFQAVATETPHSWWPDWLRWLTPLSGPKVPARVPEGAIEDAPGRYVKERI
ncbi:MAG: class I poly(R)-hydroxyalkanoic acid synthase [Sphingomonadaceae bacterium]|nr:class I poly(R)-hydroxyalkanoic acid synthase [Sphingomonadaceae bacterium]